MSLFNIFDLGDDRYTTQVAPDCFPHERQAVLSNWSDEEREMYCGVYTPARTRRLIDMRRGPKPAPHRRAS